MKNLRGNTRNTTALRHTMKYNCISSNNAVASNMHITKNSSACSNENIISNYRSSRNIISSTDCNIGLNNTVSPNYGIFMDYNTYTTVCKGCTPPLLFDSVNDSYSQSKSTCRIPLVKPVYVLNTERVQFYTTLSQSSAHTYFLI